MIQDGGERARRKQLLEKKKRKRRKRMLQRVVIIFVCVLSVFIVIKGVISVIKNHNREAQVLSEIDEKEVKSNTFDHESTSDVPRREGEIPLTQEDLSKGNLVLINNENPIRVYDEGMLVSIADNNEGAYKVKDKSTMLNKEAIGALNEMLKDFKDAKGDNEIIVISGYRDFTAQEKIHYETMINSGAEHANNYVAKPDRSEHHTGLAIDFGIYHEDGTSSEYDGTGIYSWINENCYKYGFILRYPSGKKEQTGMSEEPWHFRYVGKVHATVMNELNLCLEEYIVYLKNYTYYVNPGHGITKESKNYSIYYVPAENEMTYVPIPESKNYTISGNNKDGFIVTVSLD